MLRPRDKVHRRLFLVAVQLIWVGVAAVATWSWAEEGRIGNLYLPRSDYQALITIQNQFPKSPTLTGRVHQVLNSLTLEAGRNSAVQFCPGVSWRQVFVDRTGTAFIDLMRPPANLGGLSVQSERLCLWAMVNSVCLNIQEIKSVKFLVDGQEVDTLWGHIDLSWPLWPDESLIEDRTSGR